jgi:hypothetical protein
MTIVSRFRYTYLDNELKVRTSGSKWPELSYMETLLKSKVTLVVYKDCGSRIR